MSSTPPQGGTVFVEALEARIAPTGLYAIAGNPAFASDPHYISFATLPTGSSLGFVKASAYLGASAPDNLYAIKLTGDGSVDNNGVSTGDEFIVFNSVTGFNRAVPLAQANKGPVIAFFLDDPTRFSTDPSHVPGQVYADELVGVSVGKKAIFTINGNVHGDIVTNLLNGGNTISLTSDGKPSQGINGMTMNGNVFGNILAGGNVKSVNIVGSVYNVLAGTASNGVQYDFSGGTAAPTGIISNGGPQAGHHGANINQLTVSALSITGRIAAGDGGLTGEVGGAVTNVRVEADPYAFSIFSGAGGAGGVGVLGGAGGVIGQIIVRGAAGTTPNSPITIQAGQGGENDQGHGGSGGAVSGLAIGYEDTFDFTSNTGAVSADLLSQNVIIRGGTGGSGLKGGNGGVASNVFVNGFIPDDGATATDGSANAEIQVFGGTGGLAIAADRGKGGHGGNVVTASIENQDVEATGLSSSILIQGGAGGAGKGGGNVNDIDLLGTVITVNGGDGGSGINKGGGGGSINAVAISNLNNLYTHALTLNAGTGGDGSDGHGGNGGNITSISLSDSDLTALAINTGVHANGGRGGNGYGGAGGSVGAGETASVNLFDSAPSGAIATVTVRAGQGGDGSTNGGAGGGVDTFQLLGVDFGFSLTAGGGGNSFGNGKGGDGGSLAAVGITNAPNNPTFLADPTTQTGAVTSGTGGNGAGGSGLGGRGGDIAAVNISVIYDASLTAGGAGNGPAGTGVGGSITGAAALSLQGQVTAIAGQGGQTSGSASDGGSISGFIAAAQTNIYMIAGAGGSGGSGGSITNSGTTADALTVTLDQPTGLPNLGNLIITAGNGSSVNGVAGAGGSVTGFTGSVADGGLTAITAGNGGGGAGTTASGHGGGVDTIKLTGTSSTNETVEGFTTQTVIIDAGSAGVSDGAARGRTGGSVSNVTIYNLDEGTVVQHIAAGDGAAGLRKGGAGGNVSEVHVGLPGDAIADIGIRSGVAYGYALGGAGGIFAGVGGSGSKHSGPNGDVTGITAEAIASIVAGKDAPQLCTQVDSIYLSSADPHNLIVPLANPDGSFSNFDVASFVGSIQDPTAAGASTYKQGDGLIAAANLLGNTDFGNRNFVPEATLTNSGNDRVLVDYLEQNAQLFNTNPFIITDPAPAYLG